MAPASRLVCVPIAALLLLTGCSSERLSERTHYRADVVATTTAAAPTVPAVAPPRTTTTTVSAAATVAKPATTVAPPPAATTAAAPPATTATTTPAPAPATTTATKPTHQAARSPRPAVSPDQQARATVLAFHRLLNQRDPGACDLLTPRFARASFGGGTDDAFAQCRATVQAITVAVSARIVHSGRDAAGRTVDVVSHVGTVTRHQTMHLVKTGAEWLIDAAVPDAG